MLPDPGSWQHTAIVAGSVGIINAVCGDKIRFGMSFIHRKWIGLWLYPIERIDSWGRYCWRKLARPK